MSEYIQVECPVNNCGAEIEIECDYEPGDPSVGLDSYLCTPNAPTKCRDCGTTYGEAELINLRKQIDHEVSRWAPPTYEPDDDELEDSRKYGPGFRRRRC